MTSRPAVRFGLVALLALTEAQAAAAPAAPSDAGACLLEQQEIAQLHRSIEEAAADRRQVKALTLVSRRRSSH
jgi:hypothetical protein